MLCVCLETMEIQLEQSLLFESDENTLFLSVKSKGHICISKEHEVFVCKLIPTMRSQAILLFCFHGEIDGQTLLICCILVFRHKLETRHFKGNLILHMTDLKTIQPKQDNTTHYR